MNNVGGDPTAQAVVIFIWRQRGFAGLIAAAIVLGLFVLFFF